MRSLKSELAKMTDSIEFQVTETHAPSRMTGRILFRGYGTKLSAFCISMGGGPLPLLGRGSIRPERTSECPNPNPTLRWGHDSRRESGRQRDSRIPAHGFCLQWVQGGRVVAARIRRWRATGLRKSTAKLYIPPTCEVRPFFQKPFMGM
jgi:hypothetical protein